MNDYDELILKRLRLDVDDALVLAYKILLENRVPLSQLEKLTGSDSFGGFGAITGAPDVVMKAERPLSEEDGQVYAACRLWVIAKKIKDLEVIPPQAMQQLEYWRNHCNSPIIASTAVSKRQSKSGRGTRWHTVPLVKMASEVYARKTNEAESCTAKEVFYDLDTVEIVSPIESIEKEGDCLEIFHQDTIRIIKNPVCMSLQSFENLFCKHKQEIIKSS